MSQFDFKNLLLFYKVLTKKFFVGTFQQEPLSKNFKVFLKKPEDNDAPSKPEPIQNAPFAEFKA